MPLSNFQKDYVVKMWVKHKKSMQEVQESYDEKFGETISRTTVQYIVKERELELNPHGGSRRGVGEKEFMRLYKENRWIIEKMARFTYQRCSARGLKSRCSLFKLPHYYNGTFYPSFNRKKYLIELERFELLHNKYRGNIKGLIRKLEEEIERKIVSKERKPGRFQPLLFGRKY